MSTRSVRPGSRSGQVTLRYWASARAAADTGHDVVDVAGPVTLAELRTWALQRHAGSARFADVLGTCSVLVGERPVGRADPGDVVVEPGTTVEFLPPFAGG
ncbi:MAG: MoaD/ThiS family protein [Marmoricola sp.]